ncbi:MAG: tetratricopeptide repeat protein [Bernardetiaceae bacterium]|nr:tetratricopeptide repeat protein [Bernardetiaceae bacterium]
MRFIFCYCILIFFPVFATLAQDRDAIIKILVESLDTVSSDIERVDILNELRYYHTRNEFNTALDYANQALVLAQKIQYIKGEAAAYDGLGAVYEHLGDYGRALSYKIESLKVYESNNNVKGIAQTHNNIGVFYYRREDFEKSLYHYEKALEVAQALNDSVDMAIYWLNIGEVHQELGNFDRAIEYELKTLEISEKFGIKDNIAYAKGIIGKVREAQGRLMQAEKYQMEALNLFAELDDDMGVLEYALSLSGVYLKQKNLVKAEQYARQSLDIAIDFGAKDWIQKSYLRLAEISEAQDKISEAYNYFKKYDEIKGELLNETALLKIAQAQALYESEKSQAQIAVLTKEKEIDQIKIYGLGAILLVMLILIFVIWRGSKLRKEANTKLKLQNDKINLQKEEIATQHSNIEERNKALEKQNIINQIQRKELEKKNEDITASIAYAKRIQDAILPSLINIQRAIPNSFIFFKPRDIVSGDFYWFHANADGTLIIAAADCTGHGVPGAFMSMIANDLLNNIIVQDQYTKPAEILEKLHADIRKVLKQDETRNQDGLDIAICAIAADKKSVIFAGAKNPLILFEQNPDKGLIKRKIKADRKSIGGENKNLSLNFKNHYITVEYPTFFYIFSDGFQDQFGGPQNRKYMSKHFYTLLESMQAQKPIEQVKILENELQDWMMGTAYKQIDDMLIIGFKLD